MKTGVLGGTFDPIHNGHLAIAEEARLQLGLDEVYFLPAAWTPLKEKESILDGGYRLQMVRLAISSFPYFKVSELEMAREGLSYTVDTVVQLKNELGAGGELYFIIGLDSLAQLPRWKEPSRIIEMCYLVAAPRPGYTVPDIDSLEADVPGITRKLVLLDKPEIDVSATEIRQRAADGLPIGHLVPEAVAEYISENGLYKKNRQRQSGGVS